MKPNLYKLLDKMSAFGGFYGVISAFAMLVHFSYLILFFSEDVYVMGVVNIFSVAIYALGILHMRSGKSAVDFMQLALLEIILHAILATLFTGSEYGFQMFLICMIPVPYMLSIKNDKIMHAISVAILLTFLLLKYVCEELGIHLGGEFTVDPGGWNVFNSLISFIIIILVTNNFRYKNIMLNRTLAEQNADLQKAASTDALTGLFNRRAMNNYFSIAEQNEKGYSIAMLDIDFFKQINDNYGHDAGDIVLVEIAKILLSAVPTEGFICRWGGEEILILLPANDIGSATELAHRLSRDIAACEFEWDDKRFSVTVTVGVSYSPKGTPSDHTVTVADNRLYLGKKNGRNMVVSEG